jgi:hypothetical protein
MPYKSLKQSRFMHASHPKIAAKWDREAPGGLEKMAARSKRRKRRKRAGGVGY